MSDPKRTKRLAQEILAGSRQAMPVILKKIPPPYDWGFFSNEEARMHLQIYNPEYRPFGWKVWLEERGRRVCEDVGGNIPGKVLRALRERLELGRSHVETMWLGLMIKKSWIERRLTGSTVVLTVYPDTPNQFTRVVDLRSHFQSDTIEQLTLNDVHFNKEYALLEIFDTKNRTPGSGTHIDIAPILWTN